MELACGWRFDSNRGQESADAPHVSVRRRLLLRRTVWHALRNLLLHHAARLPRRAETVGQGKRLFARLVRMLLGSTAISEPKLVHGSELVVLGILVPLAWRAGAATALALL